MQQPTPPLIPKRAVMVRQPTGAGRVLRWVVTAVMATVTTTGHAQAEDTAASAPAAAASAEVIAAHIHVQYQASGSGPLVVLQSGLGDGLGPWAAVQRGLAGRRPVLSYDRPGYGRSAAVAGPRSPCDVATELHQLLQALALPPPYLLVGHSIGGLYQYAFSLMYPDEVAGLLLLDATHPQHWPQVQAQAPAQAALLRGLKATAFSATERREFDDQLSCMDRFSAAPSPTRRAALLVRSRFEMIERGSFERLTHAEEADWLRLIGATHAEPVIGAGHYIQREQPAAVLAAIERLLASPP